jgi:hypothetical protein
MTVILKIVGTDTNATVIVQSTTCVTNSTLIPVTRRLMMMGIIIMLTMMTMWGAYERAAMEQLNCRDRSSDKWNCNNDVKSDNELY